MLKDIKITKKLPLVMISFALLSAIVTSVVAFTSARDSAVQEAQDKLISLLESRKSSLEQYFSTIKHDVQFHAQSPLVIDALRHFSTAWQKLPNDETRYLRANYILNNPYTAGEKRFLLASDDGSDYSRIHRQYHPVFSNMLGARSFYDLFLFDPNGNMVYSVKKEADFATNIITGQWKDTHMAQAFRGINSNPKVASMLYVDFMPYAPSLDKPASFIGVPVFDQQHHYLGVLMFQLPIEPLNKVMQTTAGMGASGETYLVGKDLLMRSDSRFFKDRSILKTKVDTHSVHQGLDGKSGINIIPDYRNISVFSAYTPVDFLGTRWAMIVEIDQSEVLRPVYILSRFLFMGGIIIAVVIFVLGYLLASDISHPIISMTKMMKRLSNNELDVNISVGERKDEVGCMADALLVFKQNAIEREQLEIKLKYVADHDALTGLYARGYAMEQLDRLLETANSASFKVVVMFVDLDNFKLINDVQGHQVGDTILCEVANGLKNCVRAEDIIARIGGDEFIIIMPNVKQISDSQVIVNKIISEMDTSLSPLHGTKKLTLSIGLSVYPDDANDASSLLKNADSAMYIVKKGGKNGFNYWA